MKLGKKLEVTDKKERMKLLIDGEVFYTKNGNSVFFDEGLEFGNNPFRFGNNNDNDGVSGAWDLDLYYPAKTYTINGVELEDNRLSYDETLSSRGFYQSPAIPTDTVMFIKNNPVLTENRLKAMCDHGLIHSTAESAMAHTKVMLKVTENN